jgi:hypothetical protein
MDLSRDTALVGAESKDPAGSYLTDAIQAFSSPNLHRLGDENDYSG